MMHFISLSTIISSSLLILLLVLLRYVLRGYIKLRLQYALWLLVALRLLLPFNIGTINFSVSSVADTAALEQQVEQVQLQLRPYQPLSPEQYSAETGIPLAAIDQAELEAYAGQQTTVSLNDLLFALWLVGAILLLGWQILVNLRFAHKLRQNARPYPQAEASLPVYQADMLRSPCLFGVFHPAIYLDRPVSGQQLQHILLHEQCHYKHGDHIWALVRALCLSLHWFNPLVWWACVLSRRDAELACDEAVLEILGRDQRRAYGETLLSLIRREEAASGKNFTAATSMGTQKRMLKERLLALSRHKRYRWYGLAVVIMLLLVVLPCIFGGEKDQPLPDGNTKYSSENSNAESNMAAQQLYRQIKLISSAEEDSSQLFDLLAQADAACYDQLMQLEHEDSEPNSIDTVSTLLAWLNQRDLSSNELQIVLGCADWRWDGAYSEAYSSLLGKYFRADTGSFLTLLEKLTQPQQEAATELLAADLFFYYNNYNDNKWAETAGLTAAQQQLLQQISQRVQELIEINS